MMRLMPVLMLAVAVCACTPVLSGMGNIAVERSDTISFCSIECDNVVTDVDSIFPGKYELDGLMRSAPF